MTAVDTNILVYAHLDHWRELSTILSAGKIRGAQIHDARVAAICAQHGVREFWSADRDFSRMGSIRIVNPLS